MGENLRTKKLRAEHRWRLLSTEEHAESAEVIKAGRGGRAWRQWRALYHVHSNWLKDEQDALGNVTVQDEFDSINNFAESTGFHKPWHRGDLHGRAGGDVVTP